MVQPRLVKDTGSVCEYKVHAVYQGCWHEISQVGMVFSDGAVWAVNPKGFGRRLVTFDVVEWGK
jgi:hypothetical protein|tara:strand:+ start:576 stop:767 length:192 start_codon:yes stop_codon:yes gene_type:complete